MNRTRPTEKSIFFVGYDFFQRPIYYDGLSNQVMDLYSIKPPEIPDIDSAEEERKKKEPPPSERNAVLTPFSTLLSPEASSFSALGSSTLCVFSVNSDFSNEIWMLDTATDYRGWKRGPPMSASRRDPRTVVLDGNLYVLEGLRYDLAEEHRPFMEVFDPDVGTWEPLLPNPPFMGFRCHEMVTASLAHKKQILVVLLHRDTYNAFYKSNYTTTFYVYNVMDRSWAELVPPRKLISGGSQPIFDKTVIAVGDILYWVSGVSHIFVFQAYDLLKDEWFEGCLNVSEEIFENGEIFDRENLNPYRLIHLCDQKFCVLLQCSISPNKKDKDRRRSEYFKLREFDFYLCSVILELSPNLEKDKDREGFRELNIAVVSMEKYLVPRHLVIKDALLV